MHELMWAGLDLTRLNSGHLLTLLIIAIGAGTGGVIAVTAILGDTITNALRLRHEAALKHAMIERGMSAEEIVDVINARHQGPKGRRHGAAPVKGPREAEV